jgi:hypothetical protein
MRKKIKKILYKIPSWFELLPLLLFASFFLFLRTKSLSQLPVYLDEAIYINWASMFKHDHGLAYASMQDGKTPLFFGLSLSSLVGSLILLSPQDSFLSWQDWEQWLRLGFWPRLCSGKKWPLYPYPYIHSYLLLNL